MREVVAEPIQHPPAATTIVADENARRLCAGVEPPGDERADHERLDDPPFEPGTAPGPAGIVAAQNSVALGTGVGGLPCLLIGGNPATVKSPGPTLNENFRHPRP